MHACVLEVTYTCNQMLKSPFTKVRTHRSRGERREFGKAFPPPPPPPKQKKDNNNTLNPAPRLCQALSQIRKKCCFPPLLPIHFLYWSLEQASITLNPRSLTHLLRCQAYTHGLLGSECYSCSRNNTQHNSLARSCFEMPRRN